MIRRRMFESVEDELTPILNKLGIDFGELTVKNTKDGTSIELNGEGFILEPGDKVKDFEEDVIDILKKGASKKTESRRKYKNEFRLFGKHIAGALAMTKKSWQSLAYSLNTDDPLLGKFNRWEADPKGITATTSVQRYKGGKAETWRLRVDEVKGKLKVTLLDGNDNEVASEDGLMPNHVGDEAWKLVSDYMIDKNIMPKRV